MEDPRCVSGQCWVFKYVSEADRVREAENDRINSNCFELEKELSNSGKKYLIEPCCKEEASQSSARNCVEEEDLAESVYVTPQFLQHFDFDTAEDQHVLTSQVIFAGLQLGILIVN